MTNGSGLLIINIATQIFSLKTGAFATDNKMYPKIFIFKIGRQSVGNFYS